MDLGLAGSKAIITGGSKGIGRETARILAEEGCDVAITARDGERLEMVAKEISDGHRPDHRAAPGDMSVQADVERSMNAAIDELGHVDILVTCAGSSPGGLLEELTEGLAEQPRAEVHGVRALLQRPPAAHAGAGDGQRRAGRGQRRAQVLVLGAHGRRRQRGRHQLRERHGRAVRPARGPGQHRQSRAGQHRPLGRAGEAVRPRPGHTSRPKHGGSCSARCRWGGSASRRRWRASSRSSPRPGRATCLAPTC